jgi:transposase-like protein
VARSKKSYSDKDRALVYAELTVNDGNIMRTSRNTGIPVSTVRTWSQKWAKDGRPPDGVQEELVVATTDFLIEATRVRDKLLVRLESLIDEGKVSPRDVTTALGVLSDKIRAYEQFNKPQKVEHTFQLPPPDEIRELFLGAVSGMVAAAQTRSAELEYIDVEPVELIELPSVPEVNS